MPIHLVRIFYKGELFYHNAEAINSREPLPFQYDFSEQANKYMILLIDNYDSFVFNLARYVAELGYEYVVYRNDKLNINDIREIAPTHIIISPGPCSPNEAGISLALIDNFKAEIPILGVCLGHQAIAQACGGKVVRATYPKHGKADKIYHKNEGIFRNLPNPLIVGRYHSLIVEKESLPPELKVTALTSVGEIMALQHTTYSIFGVQFHPESVLTEHGHALLSQFMQSTAVLSEKITS